MDKAPDYESGDCKFESCRDHNFYNYLFVYINYIVAQCPDRAQQTNR